MISISPKIEIINHFDNLINNIDIDIERSLENFNDKQVLGELLKSSEDDRRNFRDKEDNFNVKFHNTIGTWNSNIWPESTKVVDYLYQIRMKTIEELRKAQNDYLEYYKLSSSNFKSQLTEKNSIDELRSELFADKFYFQVKLRQPTKRLWYFEVFTFVTDFYMSPSDIDSLEKLINAEKEPFSRAHSPCFDQIMVLIGLLYKSFIENLSNFPSHVIRLVKQDVLNIESIQFLYDYSGIQLANSMSIDLSRLVKLDLKINEELLIRKESAEINIEGLSSLKTLHVAIYSLEVSFSIRNLPSLRNFHLSLPKIDENIIIPLLDQMQYIEELVLNGKLSYFNLDNLFNLRRLCISGPFIDGFNFELFKNLSIQLEHLKFRLDNIEYEIFDKLLNGHIFSNLVRLHIEGCNMRRLEKKFIVRFPNLVKLAITNCSIETIEDNAFSNLKDLKHLDLSENFLEILYKRYFSASPSLEEIILDKNDIKLIEEEMINDLRLIYNE